jgi:HEAT repeat protein
MVSPELLQGDVADALLQINHPDALPLLTRLATTADSDIARKAILGLGWLGSKEACSAIEDLKLAPDDADTRRLQQAAMWMCRFSGTSVALREAAASDDVTTRLGACLLLARAPTQANLQTIEKAMAKETEPFIAAAVTQSVVQSQLPWRPDWLPELRMKSD